MNICKQCQLTIRRMDTLRCVVCKECYHYTCVNMTTAQFMARNNEVNRIWCCFECSKITLRRNVNTPCAKLNETTMSIEDYDDRPEAAAAVNVLNTLSTEQPPYKKSENEPITLSSIGKQLDIKLTENNMSLIIYLKDIIKTQIFNAVTQFKSEITQNLTEIRSELESHNTEINNVNERITYLQSENDRLKDDIQKLEHRIANSGEVTSTTQKTNNKKVIVLYGLDEYRYETQEDLYDRVAYLFYDILGININPYVEDLRRIGKRGPRRPLAIELISSRMAKYILDNRYCFKNSGISVSVHLDQKEQEVRKQLRKIMLKARESGKFSIIRNNKLFIDGREQIQTNYLQDNTQNTADPVTTPIKCQLPPSTPTAPSHGNLNIKLTDEENEDQTWLTQAKAELMHFENYHLAAAFHRENYNGGGVAILINDAVNYIERKEIMDISVANEFNNLFATAGRSPPAADARDVPRCRAADP
ncbi:uncharacterized protein LOC134754716 [Cydia strobilella]|uniref:uncharacterized protein LOC134754716 n=1 Tax=Cydia strobilella TaxID=1100964 RepID=UPI003003CD44